MKTTEIQSLNSQSILNQESPSLPNLSSNFRSNQEGTYDQINELFNEKDKEQKDVQEAREILGESAKDLSDSQVYDLVNEIQYLVDSWLEEYERKVFDGKTLDELLGLQK